MTLGEYQTLTGITVSSANTARVTAELAHTQSILEDLLGYTLTPGDVDTNLYNELGKTVAECSCPDVDVDSLTAPDAVVTAYRLFPYNSKDKFFHIDPYAEINAIKLVHDNITIKTYEDSEFREVAERYGIKKYVEKACDCNVLGDCEGNIQLAVDADWLWDAGDTMPTDLQLVQAEMTTYYSDRKRKIKSEGIGPHSYTRSDNTPPEQEQHNMRVIRRYAGPFGSVNRNVTI